MSDETKLEEELPEPEAENTDADPALEPVDGEAVEPEPAPPTPDEIIAGLEAEKAELSDKLLRSLAEVDNVRKRAAREVADARVFAIEKFAGDLLSVSDNLSRAMDALDADTRAALSEGGQSLMGGIEMTQKELHAVLARHNVTAIDAVPGAAFDPNFHQAVSQIPSDQPSGAIAMTFQSGWKIGERTLRAAMVAVSTGPAN
ncbi:MAG: nucleotide exchange factor GrpE [Pseudomonadota bacterium]